MFIAVVPAFNEEKNIARVAQGLWGQVDKVVVVDDGSTDNTVLEAEKSGAVVLKHKINRGQGAALQTGQEYAQKIGADYVLHFDADGQFNPADIQPAWEKIKSENADILFGSRFLDKRSQIPWLKKNILFPIARLFNKLFGVYLSDIHNGFRILNKKAFTEIIIEHDRMAHATEIPVKAKKLGLKYLEFPVEVVYHRYGQGVGGGMKVVGDLVMGKFVD